MSDAYYEGYNAHKYSKCLLSDNPYTRNSFEYKEWRNGYMDAIHDLNDITK